MPPVPGIVAANQKSSWFAFNAPTRADAWLNFNVNYHNSTTFNASNVAQGSVGAYQSKWIIALYEITAGTACSGPVFTPLYHSGTTTPIYCTNGILSVGNGNTDLQPYLGHTIYAQLMLDGGAGGTYLMSVQGRMPDITLGLPTTSSLNASWSGPYSGVGAQRIYWRPKAACTATSNSYAFHNLSGSATSYPISNLTSGQQYDAWLLYQGTGGTNLNSRTVSLGTIVGCSAAQPKPTVTHVIGHCSRVNVTFTPTVTPATVAYPYRLYYLPTGSAGYYTQALSTTSTTVTNLHLNTSYSYYYRVYCTGGATVVSGITKDTTCNTVARVIPNTESDHVVYEVNGTYFVDMDINEVITAAEANNETAADGQEHFVPLHIVDMPNALDAMTAPATTTTTALLTGSFSLIPNPTTNRVKVEYNLPSENMTNTTIKVMDMSGRVMRELKLENPTQAGYVNIDLTDLNSGVYLVNVQTEGYTETKKLVVNT
jgi:hypothetical protein